MVVVIIGISFGIGFRLGWRSSKKSENYELKNKKIHSSCKYTIMLSRLKIVKHCNKSLKSFYYEQYTYKFHGKRCGRLSGF
jgi:hypothetical protein